MDKKILVSLTSTDNPDWNKNIADLKKFGVNEFALFVTALNTRGERQHIYNKILDGLPGARIPFCHIQQQDMPPDELDFLVEKFGSKIFNIHPVSEYPLNYDYSEYRNMIFVENSGPSIRNGLKASDVEGFGGVCLDLSHLENSRLQNMPGYRITYNTAEMFTIGVNHVSTIMDEMTPSRHTGNPTFETHEFTELKQFDYLKRFPSKFFANFIALELINPIAEQLEAKKYIETTLRSKLTD